MKALTSTWILLSIYCKCYQVSPPFPVLKLERIYAVKLASQFSNHDMSVKLEFAIGLAYPKCYIRVWAGPAEWRESHSKGWRKPGLVRRPFLASSEDGARIARSARSYSVVQAGLDCYPEIVIQTMGLFALFSGGKPC